MQGGAIARALLRQGEVVRGIVRSANSPLPPGVERAVADLGDPATLTAAFAGVSNATITLPLVYDPAIVDRYAQNIAAAAADAGVERLVFNTRVPSTMTGIAGFDTRLSAERIFRSSGVPTLCLQPAVYLENLLAPAAVLAIRSRGERPYPLPADMAISWIRHADLAKAVCAAYQLPLVPESSITIDTRPLTGPELASELSTAFSRPISYVPLDPGLFEQSLATHLGAEAAAGVARIYRWAFQTPASTLMLDGETGLRDELDIEPLNPDEWALQQPWYATTLRY